MVGYRWENPHASLFFLSDMLEQSARCGEQSMGATALKP